MESLGGSLLSACLEAVLDRLKSIDWLKYVDEKQLLEQLVKWEKMLEGIYDVLDDVEEMQTTSRSAEIWLNDLKHFAYDLEDVLDEIETEVQHLNLEDRDIRKMCHFLEDEGDGVRPSKKPRLISQAWKWISSLPGVSKWSSSFPSAKWRTAKFNWEMVSKIDEISARLDEILTKKEILKLHKSNRRRRFVQANERPPSTSLVNEAKIYGREEDKEAILKLLEATTHNTDIVVIPIIGMGGVGKTTLAQLIYNDTKLQYDFKAWVSVGEDFDVFRITKTILQSNDEKDLDSLQVKLKQKLSGKKFLFVLDDVWSENYELWTLLCFPFEAGAPGSRIIITSRSWEVSRMTTGAFTTAHNLNELSYDECLSVFCQHALGATNFDQHLDVKAIGEEIVKRCRGLPLAAKALGGLLRGKFNSNAWEEVLKSAIWDLPENKINILPSLRLSYLHLPPPLKRCFAYCSIFPKGYEFDRNELVLLWMAEGFLCQQNKVKQRDYLGHEYFDELLSRSFFQRSSDNRLRYVIHDLINDLAHLVSRDTCFHLVENELASGKSYADIRHSSFIVREYNVSRRFDYFYKMMKLRTFLSLQQSNYYGRNYLSSKVLYDLLPKLKCLRVLSLTNYYIQELPSCVGELKQLRYLDLSYTNISRLPDSISKLFHLETLKLHNCRELIELPKSICNLTNLLYLDISWTGSLKELPPQIGNLTSLRMLSKFIVGDGNDGLKISELKKLYQLVGKLEIGGLHNVGGIKDGDLIKEKPGLLELYLEWGYRTANSSIQDEQTLKSLEPHQNASSLSISGFGGRQFPSWVGDPIFDKMVKLELLSCKHIKLFPPLGRLPSMRELTIRRLSGVEEVGSEFYGDGSSFPCLESLEISDMSEWKLWEDSIGRFHKLRKLKIKECPILVGKLPSFLPSLEQLEISGCQRLTDLPSVLPSLKKVYIDECQEAVLRNLTNVPCLSELKISGIKGLLILDESYLRPMAALQKLYISGCNELKCLWAHGTDSDYLTSLKHLVISGCVELVQGVLPLNLEYLNISSCPSLEVLQLTNGGLHSLKSFGIDGCPSLEVLFDIWMPSLEPVEVKGCKSVSCSPNGRSAGCLKFLKIGEGAKQLLESFRYGFSHLTDLSISGCDELESFPEKELPNIPTLVSLELSCCKKLKSLTYHMQSLRRLQSLSIVACDEFEWFPVGGLPNCSIVTLEINSCSKLRYLPNQMQNLNSLQCLIISSTEISSLQGCLPPNLSQLNISHCEKLIQPMAKWGLHTLTSLRRLTIRSSPDMVSFPDNDGLLLPTSLTFLEISGFKNLESISRGIQNLISLRELYIAFCPELESFPVESLPPALEFLEILSVRRPKDWFSKYRGEYGPIISY